MHVLLHKKKSRLSVVLETKVGIPIGRVPTSKLFLFWQENFIFDSFVVPLLLRRFWFNWLTDVFTLGARPYGIVTVKIIWQIS